MKPNIVFIVADDLGFADLGCYGGRTASFGAVSPVLDALAANGMRFTQGYSNSPVCSPTRFALMTARWQYRLRGAAEEPINSKSRGSATLGLPPEHPTLPSLLREAGYAHRPGRQVAPRLPAGVRPAEVGLRRVLRADAGGVDYFTHCASTGTHDLYGRRDRAPRGRLPDRPDQRARGGLCRPHGGRSASPFFLSLHYTAPHWPWETRDDAALAAQVRGNLFHLDGGSVDTYRRMIHHMDEGIGRVMAALRRHGSTATRWWSSPATTAASASRTTGRWSAARWTSPKAASACPGSCTGRR
jgi:arylsulfatase A-like enzyme